MNIFHEWNGYPEIFSHSRSLEQLFYIQKKSLSVSNITADTNFNWESENA